MKIAFFACTDCAYTTTWQHSVFLEGAILISEITHGRVSSVCDNKTLNERLYAYVASQCQKAYAFNEFGEMVDLKPYHR